MPDSILVAFHLLFTESKFIACLILQIIGVSPVIHIPPANHITMHIILELYFTSLLYK